MRILLIVPFLKMGGADRFNLDLARMLTGRGHTLSIIATLPGTHEWHPQFAAITPDITLLSHIARPERHPAFLRDLIRSRSTGAVIVSNSQLGYAALPYLRAHCPDVPFLDFLHMEEEHWHNGGYPQISLEQARNLDLTIVSSQHLRAWMLARGGDPARIAVCYTSIDQDAWNPSCAGRDATRQALDLPHNESVILFAARLVPQKRPRMVLDVLQRCSNAGARFTALIAGDGPERGWLERMIRRRRLAQVRILGAVSNDRVRELLAASDIFFLPSAHEGIALTLYEAMAMGVVPVAADVGGQRELVTPDCGILVPPSGDETAAYVTAIIGLLTDPVRRAAMGGRARQRIVDHFRLDLMGDRMDAFIRHAVEHSVRAGRATPAPEEAERSAIEAIQLARQARNVARLWETGGYAGDVDLSPARRVALRIVRSARKHLRPWYRRLAARDDSRLRRGVLTVRDRVVRWVYRE